MLSYLFGQKAAPERVVTDHVVPVGFFDNTILFRTFVMYTLFVFDDVLDPERLRTSLEQVVNRPGWKKLGARLRRTVGSFATYGLGRADQAHRMTAISSITFLCHILTRGHPWDMIIST